MIQDEESHFSDRNEWKEYDDDHAGDDTSESELL